jgi:hypothetical protein
MGLPLTRRLPVLLLMSAGFSAAGFEGMPVESFTEIASRLNEDGTFLLDRNAKRGNIWRGAVRGKSHPLFAGDR